MVNRIYGGQNQSLQNSRSEAVRVEKEKRGDDECPYSISQARECIQQAWLLDNIIGDDNYACPQKERHNCDGTFQLAAFKINPSWVKFFAQNSQFIFGNRFCSPQLTRDF